MALLWGNHRSRFEPHSFPGRNAVDITIKQRLSSNVYEIIALGENYNAKKIPLSPTGEIQLINSYGSHISRIKLASLLSSTYNIIVNGGGFYQFGRNREIKHGLVCKGEQEIFQIVGHRKRKISIMQGD